MQNLQRAKIDEVSKALVEAGYHSLDEQAEALCVHRSTAWTIVKSQCKGTGLTAATINRILASPGLPDSVRTKVLEYVREKSAGHYGHKPARRRKFAAQLEHSLINWSADRDDGANTRLNPLCSPVVVRRHIYGGKS